MQNGTELGADVRQWIQEVADRDYDGSWIDCAAALLTAAYVAEKSPADPWAGLTARQRSRRPVSGR